jgi:hypothetical protein
MAANASVLTLPAGHDHVASVDRGPRIFVATMLFASLLGFATGPLIAPEWWPDNPQKTISYMLHFVASMHIGLTYFLYVDRDAKELIESQKYRFYLVSPLLFLVFFVAFYYGSVIERNLIWVSLGAWTLWHFQKQNFGIFCLLATARNEISTRSLEKKSIYLGGFAGICLNAVGYAGGLSALGLPGFVYPCFVVGCVLQAAATGLALWIIYADRQNITLRHFFLLLFSSYWLTLGILPWGVAWMTCAAGHGYQYVAIMTMVGAESGENFRDRRLPRSFAPFIGVAVTAAIGLLVYGIGGRLIYHMVPQSLQSDALSNGILGLSFAFTGVHYVLDAGIWRLNKPIPRKYVRRKLALIFNPAAASGQVDRLQPRTDVAG